MRSNPYITNSELDLSPALDRDLCPLVTKRDIPGHLSPTRNCIVGWREVQADTEIQPPGCLSHWLLPMREVNTWEREWEQLLQSYACNNTFKMCSGMWWLSAHWWILKRTLKPSSSGTSWPDRKNVASTVRVRHTGLFLSEPFNYPLFVYVHEPFIKIIRSSELFLSQVESRWKVLCQNDTRHSEHLWNPGKIKHYLQYAGLIFTLF